MLLTSIGTGCISIFVNVLGWGYRHETFGGLLEKYSENII